MLQQQTANDNLKFCIQYLDVSCSGNIPLKGFKTGSFKFHYVVFEQRFTIPCFTRTVISIPVVPACFTLVTSISQSLMGDRSNIT